MRYAAVKIRGTNGRLRTIRLELLASGVKTLPSGREGLVVTGYKVNKEGDYIGPADVMEVQVIIGAESLTELVSDYKYGELVEPHKASQNTNPDYMETQQ